MAFDPTCYQLSYQDDINKENLNYKQIIHIYKGTKGNKKALAIHHKLQSVTVSNFPRPVSIIYTFVFYLCLNSFYKAIFIRKGMQKYENMGYRILLYMLYSSNAENRSVETVFTHVYKCACICVYDYTWLGKLLGLPTVSGFLFHSGPRL